MDLLEVSGIQEFTPDGVTACPCKCTSGSTSSQQTGDYYSVCGCSCEGGSANFNGNLGGAEG